MSVVKDILTLLDKGYMYYSGYVPENFYRDRRCQNPKKAEWFSRPLSKEHKHSRYICIGCRKRCSVADPAGWQVLLPVNPKRTSAVAFAPAWPLSVEELLNAKSVLRTDEAAWALNLSQNVIYDMIQDGRLDAVEGFPVRVTVESVRRRLEPVAP